MQGLTPGRNVHYVGRDFRNEPEHFAAIVIRVDGAPVPLEGDPNPVDPGIVDLVVFDRRGCTPALYVKHDAHGSLGTWHWIEPV